MEKKFDFRKWIAAQSGNYEYRKVDENHIQLVTPYTVAQINFHDIGDGEDEVVEFKIVTDNENEPKFFLHFQANHEAHAKELFDEFVEALEELGNKQVKEILLCCTSGFTTSYFAEKLNQAAQETGMQYTFSAVSVNEIYEAGVGKHAILLAPQISYMQKELSQIMKDSVILTIPGKLFGSFDARGYLPEMDRELRETEQKSLKKKQRKAEDFMRNDQRILIISVMASAEDARIYYRVYDGWDVEKDEVVIKKHLKLQDIEDVINMQVCQSADQKQIDRIGIAIPGIVHEGKLDLPSNPVLDMNHGEWNGFAIQKWFEEKYDLPISVNNNANAAALGWYGIHHKNYRNIVYYSQPRGWPFGGQGIVCDGKLVEGRSGAAGEIKYVMNRFSYQNPLSFNPYNPDDMIQIVCNAILMDIAILDPEVICVRCDLIAEMDRVRKELQKYIPESHIPELRYVENYGEHIMVGELLICLREKLAEE